MATKRTSSPKRKKKSDAYAKLRAFRHGVAVLKKKGLLPKSIDARKVQPTTYLKRQLRLYDDVVRGLSSTVKLSPSEFAAHKASGYRTKNGRVIVSTPPGYKNLVVGGKHIQYRKTPYGKITRLQIPIPYYNLEQWFKQLIEDKTLNGKLIGQDEYVAFRFYGNNSNRMDSNINRLAEHLYYYRTVSGSLEKNKKEQLEVYQNIEFVKFHRDNIDEFKPEGRPGAKRTRKSKGKTKKRKYVPLSGPALEQRTIYRKKYFDSLPVERQEVELERRRLAAKNSREKRKNKNGN